jgi:hypothetical protein
VADLASQKIGFSQNASQDEEVDAFFEPGCKTFDMHTPSPEAKRQPPVGADLRSERHWLALLSSSVVASMTRAR